MSYGFRGHLPEAAYEVLSRVYDRPLALASNYARENLPVVCLLASLGYISTVHPDGRDYGAVWRLTAAGLHALEAHHNPTIG